MKIKRLSATTSALFLLLSILYSLSPTPVKAVCPVCTVAVGAGLGISRLFGIDDSVSSVWIGGLILSSSFWLSGWLEKKLALKSRFKHLDLLITLIFYILVIAPLSWSGIIGLPFNQILGVDKIIFGTFIGSVVFLLGVLADKKVRELRGRQLFKYQKVIFPILALSATSLILYLTTR